MNTNIVIFSKKDIWL